MSCSSKACRNVKVPLETSEPHRSELPLLGFQGVCTKALQISGHSWKFCLSVTLWKDAWQRQTRMEGWASPEQSHIAHLPPHWVPVCEAERKEPAAKNQPGTALCVFRQQGPLPDLFSTKRCSHTLFLKSFIALFAIPITFLQRNVFPSTLFSYPEKNLPPIPCWFLLCCHNPLIAAGAFPFHYRLNKMIGWLHRGSISPEQSSHR